MAVKTAFDNERYISEQTEEILQRSGKFHNKLYLEFGGKLMFDFHAARVLPGWLSGGGAIRAPLLGHPPPPQRRVASGMANGRNRYRHHDPHGVAFCP